MWSTRLAVGDGTDTNYHYTHWDVEPHVREKAEDCVVRFGGSLNTYFDHPPGYGLDSVSVDIWGRGGRGAPLPEADGDACVSWILGQWAPEQIQWLIWWGWIWTPGGRWQVYSGWQGAHRGADAHIHTTYVS